MQNHSLRFLIQVAYSVMDHQISGGPKWLDADRYDIHAKATGPAEDPELMLMLDAPVVDATEVPGVFDFTLEWTPENARTAATDTGPSLSAALQEPLGVKLELRKTTIEMIVVDRAEKASEN